MTPTEYLLDGLFAAHDNAHDMGLREPDDPEATGNLGVEYAHAVLTIVCDVVEGSPGSLCECGYLAPVFTSDGDEVTLTRGEVRPVLAQALGAFLPYYAPTTQE